MPAKKYSIGGRKFAADKLPVLEWKYAYYKHSKAGLRTCGWCSMPITSHAFHWKGTGYDMCASCYVQSHGDELATMLPVSDDKPWWPLTAKDWREATPEEAAAYWVEYDKRYKLRPGSQSLKAKATKAEREWGGRPPVPHDTPLLVLSTALNHVTTAIATAFSSRYSVFEVDDCGFYTPMACVACGEYGKLLVANILGAWHATCWKAFHVSGKIAEMGFKTCSYCGAIYEPAPVIPPGTMQACNGGCGRMLKPTNTPSSTRCDGCRPSSEKFNGTCKKCAGLGPFAAQTEPNSCGVPQHYDIFSATADFYILSDLVVRYPAIEEEYVKRVGAIATALARYTVAATGGELRHWEGSRNDAFLIILDDEHLPPDTISTPEQSYYCPYIPGLATKASCTHENDVHRRIRDTRGADWRRPARYLRPDSEWEDGAIRVPYIAEVTIDGVKHRTPHARSLLMPVGLSSIGGWSRTMAWVEYVDAFKAHGLPVLEACRTIFCTGLWRSGMGGPKWGQAAQLVLDYASGAISPPHFIDSILGVQHNGGTLFNKMWRMSQCDMDFHLLLDLRREADDVRALLPFASEEIRGLYCLVALASGIEELREGMQWIRECYGLDYPAMIQKFWGFLVPSHTGNELLTQFYPKAVVDHQRSQRTKLRARHNRSVAKKQGEICEACGEPRDHVHEEEKELAYV